MTFLTLHSFVILHFFAIQTHFPLSIHPFCYVMGWAIFHKITPSNLSINSTFELEGTHCTHHTIKSYMVSDEFFKICFIHFSFYSRMMMTPTQKVLLQRQKKNLL